MGHRAVCSSSVGVEAVDLLKSLKSERGRRVRTIDEKIEWGRSDVQWGRAGSMAMTVQSGRAGGMAMTVQSGREASSAQHHREDGPTSTVQHVCMGKEQYVVAASSVKLKL